MDLNQILDLAASDEVPALSQLRLPNPAWGWEYLRRNHIYREEYHGLQIDQASPFKLGQNCVLLREKTPSPDAEKWGLLRYSDPAKCSQEANVFWHPDVLAGALKVQLYPLEAGSIEANTNQDEIILNKIDAKRIFLQTADGALHIVLNGEKFWIQLHCENPGMLTDNARLGIQIEETTHFQRRIDTATQLLSLYQSSGRNLSLIGRNKNSKRLTYGLVAFDMIAAGGSHKDVAISLLGAQKVNQDWGISGQYLEDWTRRLIARANRLVDGGYRQFLTLKAL